MAKAKNSGTKEATKKKLPFGGYGVSFKGRTDSLEALFGDVPIAPSAQTNSIAC